MITPSLVYWITRLDAIIVAARAVAIQSFLLLTLGLLGSFVVTADEIGEPFSSFWKKVVRVAALALVVSGTVLVLTPTKREMAAIIVLPRIANSETVAEIGDGVKTLAVEWLEELRPNKKGDAK
jgi:uncharacterized membrane protein